MIKDDSINFAISSFGRQTSRFVSVLHNQCASYNTLEHNIRRTCTIIARRPARPLTLQSLSVAVCVRMCV